jgi:hypothetical protein
MPFELVITSLFGLFSGVISLYTDPKKHKTWRSILLGLIILSAISTVYFGYKKEQESKATEAKKDSRISNLSNDLSQVNKQNSELLQTIRAMSDDTKFIRNALTSLGWSKENLNKPIQTQVDQSLQASKFLKIVSGNPDQRRAITVEYFPKNVDPSIIRSRLEALGIRLETSASQHPGIPTNAIWVGSGVDIDTVKAVAYTLIGAGVELKMIRQLDNLRRRESSIQVGGDIECINRPTLTAEKIKNIQNFPRQSAVVKCQAFF